MNKLIVGCLLALSFAVLPVSAKADSDDNGYLVGARIKQVFYSKNETSVYRCEDQSNPVPSPSPDSTSSSVCDPKAWSGSGGLAFRGTNSSMILTPYDDIEMGLFFESDGDVKYERTDKTVTTVRYGSKSCTRTHTFEKAIKSREINGGTISDSCDKSLPQYSTNKIPEIPINTSIGSFKATWKSADSYLVEDFSIQENSRSQLVINGVPGKNYTIKVGGTVQRKIYNAKTRLFEDKTVPCSSFTIAGKKPDGSCKVTLTAMGPIATFDVTPRAEGYYTYSLDSSELQEASATKAVRKSFISSIADWLAPAPKPEAQPVNSVGGLGATTPETAVTISNVKSTAVLVDNGTQKAKQAIIGFVFTFNNMSTADVYMAKDPNVAFATSSTISRDSASTLTRILTTSVPATRAGDSSDAYIIPSGTSRTFTHTGFLDNTSGSYGNHSSSITKIYYSSGLTNFRESSIKSGLDGLRTPAVNIGNGSGNVVSPPSVIFDRPTISNVTSKGNKNYQFYAGDDVTLTGAWIASNGVVKIGSTNIQLYGDNIPDNSLTFRVPPTVTPGTYSLYVDGPALVTNKVQVTVLARLSTSPAPVTQPAITVTYPDGGETLSLGSDFIISFTPVYNKLHYFNLVNENNAGWDLLSAMDTSPVIGQATDKQIMVISKTIFTKYNIPTGRYKIEVCTKNSESCDRSNSYFTITSSANPSTSPAPVANPSITVKSPNGGEQYSTLESRTITWSTSNLPSTATISLQLSYRNKGANSNVEDVIISGIQNTGSYLWTIPSGYGVGKEPNLFWMRVIAGVGEKVEDYSNSTFTIAQTVTPAKSTAPVQSSAPVSAGTPNLSASSPTITSSVTGTTGQIYAGNMTISSTVSNAGNAPSTPMSGYFQYSTDGSYFSDWASVSIPAINSGSSYNVSYSWTGGNGIYYFKLRLPDGTTSGSAYVNIISQPSPSSSSSVAPSASPSSSPSPSGSPVSGAGSRSIIANVFYAIGDFADSLFLR